MPDDDDGLTTSWTRRPTGCPRARPTPTVCPSGAATPLPSLGLLHANGRALVDRLAAMGPITLVLDECHHLLQLWGHVLLRSSSAIDPASLVVGLTATPPEVLSEPERRLQVALFGGRADFQVVTPAVVKDGYLAPYQELALVVQPLDAEQRFIDGVGERFERLRSDVLDADFATVSFGSWFATRIVRAAIGRAGVPVGWDVVERADPLLAHAALRWCWQQRLAPPSGARMREQHHRAPGTRRLDGAHGRATSGRCWTRVRRSGRRGRAAAASSAPCRASATG